MRIQLLSIIMVLGMSIPYVADASVWDDIVAHEKKQAQGVNKNIEGIASWYAHWQTPGGSATNLYPKGTVLRVTNKETGKSVVTKITSTWSQTDARRVIDLEKNAFKKIGNLSSGIIRVTLEVLRPQRSK